MGKNFTISMNPESVFDIELDNDKKKNNYPKYPINNIEIDNFLKKEIPGLYNFEGNCYLNSILQCFYYCKDLTNYFIDNKNEIIIKGGKLSNAYLNLILRLKKKENNNSAKKFLKVLQEVSDNFFNKGGNDPKAVLFYFLENIHYELKEENSDYNEEDNCCDGIDQEIVFQKCKKNEENSKSIISELFNWCLLTKNECKKCGNYHYMCEYENNLLIILNKYKTEDNCKLDDLIKFYFQDDEKNFICDYSDSKEIFRVKFSKKIICLPQYLIIILNRDTTKFNINYNEYIDLSEYCVNEINAKYIFVGASYTNDYKNKKGTHAISLCITSEGPYIFNDLITEKYNNSIIYGYNPYILFYKKINNFI